MKEKQKEKKKKFSRAISFTKHNVTMVLDEPKSIYDRENFKPLKYANFIYTVSQKFVHLAWSTLSAYHSWYTDSKSMKIGQINNLGLKFCLSLFRLKSVKHDQR